MINFHTVCDKKNGITQNRMWHLEICFCYCSFFFFVILFGIRRKKRNGVHTQYPHQACLKLYFCLWGFELMLHDNANSAVNGGNFVLFLIEKSPLFSAGLTLFLFGVLWHFYFPLRTRVFMMQGGYVQQQQQHQRNDM